MAKSKRIETTAAEIASLAASLVINETLRHGERVTVKSMDLLRKEIIKGINNGSLKNSIEEYNETKYLIQVKEQDEHGYTN